jgi:hypothetical protein
MLKINFMTPQGVEITNALIQVNSVDVGLEYGLIKFAIYADITKPPVQARTATMPYTSGDPFSQAYAYIQTLPEFVSAVAV